MKNDHVTQKGVKSQKLHTNTEKQRILVQAKDLQNTHTHNTSSFKKQKQGLKATLPRRRPHGTGFIIAATQMNPLEPLPMSSPTLFSPFQGFYFLFFILCDTFELHMNVRNLLTH